MHLRSPRHLRSPLRSLLVAALAVLASLTLHQAAFAQVAVAGSGKIATVTRSVAAFDSIGVEDGIELSVRIGPVASVQLRGDDNLLPLVETTVSKRSLKLRLASGVGAARPSTPLRAIIVVPKLTALSVDGSGDAEVTGLAARAFSLGLSGAGRVRLSGTADKLQLGLKGSGHIEATELVAASASVGLQGAGSVRLHATRAVTAAISGEGVIEVHGKPPSVTQAIDGKGELRVL